MTRARVALVFCAHHRPWLMMSTLLTVVMQSEVEADFHVLYNVGDGRCEDRPSYAEYHRLRAAADGGSPDPALERQSYERYDALARRHGINSKLSPFDERVRIVSRVRHARLVEVELENDHALDSGAWLKYIQSGRWQGYDYVFFIQEGTLLTRPTVLAAVLRLAQSSGMHFLAAGHYKSRLPKALFLRSNTRAVSAMPIDAFHDRMIRQTFELFCRDAEFEALFERWSDDFAATQQNHVPDIWGSALWRRARQAAESREAITSSAMKHAVAEQLRRRRRLFTRADAALARAALALGRSTAGPGSADPLIYVDAVPRRRRDVVAEVVDVDGVSFHREAGPEWHGCSCNHVLSRHFLEQLSERFERHKLYEALDLPFAGTPLEVIWGFLPAWIGVDKWFFDGYHRVAKNFATYRREDDPEGMASYINRYYRGRLWVEPDGDAVRVRGAASGDLRRLRDALDPSYF